LPLIIDPCPNKYAANSRAAWAARRITFPK
jgi:hypothetical protein